MISLQARRHQNSGWIVALGDHGHTFALPPLMAHVQALLRDLIIRCAPSAQWIRGFLAQDLTYQALIKDLPDPSHSTSAYAYQLIGALDRRGLVDDRFLALIERDFPDERPAINDIRRALGFPMRLEEVATFNALMDNWSAQEIAFLLAEGASDDTTHGVIVTPEAIHWPPVLRTGVALEGLLTLLGTLILHDEIMVEEEYAHTWLRASTPLLGLAAGKILVPVRQPDNLSELKRPLYRKLYAHGPLNVAHQQLVGHIREYNEYPDNFPSQVLWGTVGYLARSAALGIAYTAHPIRQRFLTQTPFVEGRSDAAAILLGALDEVQAERLAALANALVHDVRAVLPPLALRVLREARTREDLFLVGLQVREEFSAVRRWIAHFQRALRDRHLPRIREFHRALQQALEPHRDPTAAGPLRHETFARTVLELPGLHQRVALVLQTLFVDPGEEDPLDKLFRLFEVGSSLDAPLREHLRGTILRCAS